MYPVEECLAVVLDTDTYFHHSAQARASHSVPGQGVEVPCVPLHCSVEYSQAGWRVVERETGRVVQEVPEEDVLVGATR